MKIKSKKKYLLSSLLVLGIVITSYVLYMAFHYYLYDDYKDWIQPAASAQEGEVFKAITETKADVPGMELAAENGSFKLYTNPETTAVAIYEKESGMIAYSNPENVQEDSIASGSNLSELQSQIVLEYYDANRNRIKINNYDMSILAEQFTIEQIENGIRYTYTLADMNSSTGIVPVIINEEILEEQVLSKLDEKEARDVRTKYAKSQEQEGDMILTENAIKSRIRMERLNELFTKAGFSQEDYEALLSEENIAEPLSLKIAIEYRLTNTGLNVTIPKEMIEESEGASIANIEVLKFFGAQGTEAEGYLFVPNGSGSLIYLNNGKKNEAYSQYVYDMDAPAKSYVVTENREVARLPVFGIKNEEGAIFAIIQSGDAVSQIHADVAEKKNTYNYVYPTYSLRGYELLSMFGSTGASADLPIVEKELADISFSIDYNILSGKDITYSDMAAFYQKELIEKGVLTKREELHDLPFYLDVIGGVQKQKEIAGIPYTGMDVMTSFEEASEMVALMQARNISNIRLNYLGWFNGGYYHNAAEKIRDVEKLGSKTEIENLQKKLEESGGKLFGDVAFQKVTQESKSYNITMESTKYYSGMAVVRGKINPATVREISSLGYDEAIYSIVSPKFLNRYVSGFSKEISDYAFSGISLRDLGDVLSSDKKRTEVIHREAAKDIVEHAFQQLEETGKSLMITGGNAYSLSYATDMIDIPMTGTDFYLIDQHIPFYQLLVNGYVSYAGDVANLSGDNHNKSIILDLIETGSAPRYIFSYKNSVEMKYTSLNHLYSTDYRTWLDQAATIYTTVNIASQSVLNSQMISHQIIENNVRKVTYDNGISFYINRSNREQKVDNLTIPAMEYIQVEEER